MRRFTRITTVIAATALALTGVVATATSASAATPKGKAKGYTSVTLTADAAAAILGPLGGGLLKPGVVNLSSGSVGFPIVGNSKGGVIKHTGGLSFSGENTVEIRNFWIDTNSWQLTAATFVNGQFVARAPIFDVNSSTLQVTLTAFAAGALSDLVLDSPGAIPAGFVIGTASVNRR
jgi:hypothetical protein